jgi:hypothetical protein
MNLKYREDAMKSITRTTRRIETEVEHDVSTVLFNVFTASAMLIGVWAAACLIGGLVSHGFVGMVRGYITAVTGY